MRRSLLSTCALMALLASSPAFAEGGSANALSFTWSGPYMGVHVGYGFTSSDWDFAGGGGSTSLSDNGGFAGLQIGYDAQLDNNLFVGIEGSLTSPDIKSEKGCGGNTCVSDMRAFGDISARLGLASGRTLFYLKGGVAFMDSTRHVKTPTTDNADNGGTDVGYLIGGGAEYSLLYNVTTKLEYNHMGFGSNDTQLFPSNQRISHDGSLDVFKLGFNFKFN